MRPIVLLVASFLVAAQARAQVAPTVLDLTPGPVRTPLTELAPLAGLACFAADRPTTGWATFCSDGTLPGTTTVAQGVVGHEFTVFGNMLLFEGISDTAGSEPWLTDGTPAGTFMIADLVPGPQGSSPKSFTVLGGIAFFDGWDANGWRSLYRTDGTEQGTFLVAASRRRRPPSPSSG